VRIDLTLRDAAGLSRDGALTAPAGACFGDVEPGLAELASAPAGTTWWGDEAALDAATPLGAPGLRSGSILSFDAPAEADQPRGTLQRLLVVAGPDAGLALRLTRGLHTIGRAADCDLVLSDPSVSRRHASLTVTTAGVRVHDLGSTNGTSIDGQPVDVDGTSVHAGELVRVGDDFLTLGDTDQSPAAVLPGPDGTLLVNRAPRLGPTSLERDIDIPVAASCAPAQRVQWIAALLPALAGTVLALVTHSVQFLVFLLLSPVVMLASALGDRLHWRRSRRREAATFARRFAAASVDVAAVLIAETAARRRAAPDATTLYGVATTPGARLWERRGSDLDMLQLRLGVVDLPSATQARRGANRAPAGVVRAVPAGIDLRAGAFGRLALSAVVWRAG
jgi:S-DNA-T family DNA segregation ATPase FtsK/SpoIIIE